MITGQTPDALQLVRKSAKFALIAGIVIVLLFSLLAGLFELSQVLRDERVAANKDFVSYWAAAVLIREHKNPYDSASVRAIEKLHGYAPAKGVTMRNPPIALPLVLPVGFLDLKWAAFLWSLTIIAIIGFAANVVKTGHGYPNGHIHFLGFAFPAAFSCFEAGQSSALVLLGLACFLHLHKKNPFTAGLSLALCAIKPHLLIPFAAVLLLWAFREKIWLLIAGIASGLGTLAALSMCLGAGLWQQYFVLLKTDGINREFHPVIGSLIRFGVDHDGQGMQYVPTVAGIAWAFWYFQKHRAHWDWRSHGSLLLIISLLVAPYAWFFDEIIILPAMLHAIYVSRNRERAILGFSVLSSAALLESLLGAPIFSGLYMWTTGAWLIWYLAETHRLDIVARSKVHLMGTWKIG